MSQISLKSISGITSITTSVGVDNQLTIHTNDTTERIKITSSGLNISGVCTATTFSGSGASLTSLPAANLTGTLPAISGANLTSLPAQATIANNADNRVITGGSGVNLNGEATLTYDGTSTFELQPSSATPAVFVGDSNRSGAGEGIVHFKGNWNGTTVARMTIDSGSDTTNKDDGFIRFWTAPSGSLQERLRITSTGFVGINSTTPRTNLQVTKGSSHYNPGNPTAFNSNNVLACFENSDDVEVTLLSPNNKKNIINFGDTDNVANSSIEYDHSINHLLFKVNGGSERFRINNSGAFGLAGTNYGTAGQVLTSGGTNGVPTWSTVAAGGASNISFNSGNGIDFSATADGTGSNQAELFDDYEEGSWTPAVASGNASFSGMTGRYTKVGRNVSLWFRINGGSGYSGSSALQISGIPFTNNTSGIHPVGTSEFYKIDFARDYSDHVTPYLAGQNLLWLRNNSGGGSGNYLTINLFYTSAAITGWIQYYTNS